MSPVALGLDILLVSLLLAALFVGVRLNKRLKLLREGQAGFIRAVGELDTAAARAEVALRDLRAASEDTHDALLTRIETARGLINKLDAASVAAERHLPPATEKTAAGPIARAEGRLDPRFRTAPRRPAARSIDDELFDADPLSPPAALQRRIGERL
jgi:hypothetical protein